MPAWALWLDRIGAWGLVLIGFVHNFVAAPMIYGEVSERMFWYIGAGLSLWYAGAVNLVRQASDSRPAVIAAVLVNLTMLTFVAAMGSFTGEIARPSGMALTALVAVETLFALLQAKRRTAG